jgi:hypothetical protein
MDILGNFDLNLVVVPHWNNAEGGNHDTRFCFMGEPRFRKLIALMKENVPVLGLDEHTACILDLATEEAEVRGLGSVTLRHDDREIIFTSGDRFPLSVFRGQTGDSKWKSRTVKGPAAEKGGDIDADTFWDQIHSLEESFQNGLASRDARMATNALLELDRSIWQAQTDLENDELITEARDTLRNLMVLLGTELAATPKNKAECLSPLVKELLELRHNFRSKKQWSEADAIRDVLSQVNITVEDNKNGSHWHLEAE